MDRGSAFATGVESSLLGHQPLITKMINARLNDGFIAADYYQTMTVVEDRLSLIVASPHKEVDFGQLLALVNS